MHADLTPDLLLRAYAAGIFPMAQARDDPSVHWVDPQRRGVFPLDGFHLSRSLQRRLLRHSFRVTTDTDFAGVVQACAAREETWINVTISDLYRALFAMGHAHSLELWEGRVLVGGVYGVVLGGAFCGESMFSHRTDASKMALAYLIDRLRQGGFVLFDTQFLTPHLQSLGAIEISRAAYQARLAAALRTDADFNRQGAVPAAAEVVQRRTHTS